MKYLMVIFIPPLYLFLRKKGVAFAVDVVLFGLAWLCLVTLIAAAISPVFWLLSCMVASWYLRVELVHEHAEVMAAKMAEKLVAAQATAAAGGVPSLPPQIDTASKSRTEMIQ